MGDRKTFPEGIEVVRDRGVATLTVDRPADQNRLTPRSSGV